MSFYCINLFKSDIAQCLLRAQPVHLTNGQQAQVNCLHNSCLAKSNHCIIEGFTFDEIDRQLISVLLVNK